jgi:hypothetical protein
VGHSSLGELLQIAERGDHLACRRCPSSPRNVRRTAWGVSCREHGVDWTLPTTALSMMVVQDPANTTPAETGKLCHVCNSENVSDGSAQHGLALWAAAVALAPEQERPQRYLDRHYWANAAMHSDGESLDETGSAANDGV